MKKVMIFLAATIIIGTGFFFFFGMSGSVEAQPGATQMLIVAHGIPPGDFPKDKMGAFFKLHMKYHGASHSHDVDHSHAGHKHENDDFARYMELDQEMRNWPRTTENDPYKIACDNIVSLLNKKTGIPVTAAYNEFCAPKTEDEIDRLATSGVKKIIVMPTMLTPGGNHSEIDVPRSLEKAREKYPDIEIIYAWPYPMKQITDIFIEQFNRFAEVQ